MPKGLTDAQIEKLADRIIKFETKKGSFQGTKLSIADFTKGNPYLPGQVKTREDLIGLLKDYYIPAVKKNIGEENFNKLDTSIINELVDWNFNSNRSAKDVLAYAAGDITLDKWNGSGTNPLPKNFDKITLREVEAAKHDGYKTDGKDPKTGKRYTLENPNPAYELTWKHRIGSTQENPNEFKKYFEDKGKANPKFSYLENINQESKKSPTYKDSINNRLKNKGTGVKEDVSAQGDVSNKENVSIQENKDMAEGETLKKQQEVVIGDRTITITDPYGIRGQNFKNREGQHSKGIDIVTDNDRVISLTDGVVEVAALEGSPTLVDTGKEKSGGYYLIVKNDDGTRSQYMHLDAMTPQEQKDIIGKRVKRGDDIGGYGVGSGSGTGPHVKYRVFTGEVGTQRKTHIDPSAYITGNNETGNEIKLIQDNELITEGKDKGKYKTTWEKPNGTKQTITGQDPFTKISIGNNEYFKSGDYYAMFDSETGNVERKFKKINDVYESEFVALEKKVKDGKHLNKKELQFAEQITQIKEDELQEKIEEKDKKWEGLGREVFEKIDSSKDKGRDQERLKLDKERLKIRERLLKNIAIPESQKYLDEEKVLRKEKLETLKRQSLDGSLSPEDLKSAKDQYSLYNKENKIWNEKAIKQQEKIDSYKLIGKILSPKEKNKLINKYGISVLGVDRKKLRELSKDGNLYNRPDYGDKDELTDIMKDLNSLDIPKDKEEEERIAQEGKEKQPILGGLDNQSNVNRGSSTTSVSKTTGGTLADGKAVSDVDPNGMINKDEDLKEIAPYIDEEYLLNQNALDQETIDFIRNQKEFNAELPEQEEDYDNILGNITDIGKGVVGLAGAMEDVPEYQTGDMYNEYTEDARRLKDQGLSKEEIDFMKSNAERAFGFGMQQFRGAGASSALVGAGQQAAILAGQSAKIAALDQGVRRQNRQYFANAAVADESINRQKFEDKFTQSMLNKKEGAALARDAYTNMNERAQFEKQYGKDSQYQQLMNENLLSMREARENKKRSQANQKETSINKLKQQILDRQAKMKKTA